MLADGLEPAIRAQYHERVVTPRRGRLRAILGAGVATGALPASADLEVAGSFLTGSWYSFALGGASPPDDWARRVTALVWRACAPDQSTSTATVA